MEQRKVIRNLIFSEEFLEYYNNQPSNVQTKFDYVMEILQKEQVPTTKFIKKLENTDFYEMRVSLGNNEYRSVLFSIDNDNIINATQVLLLNSFLKKSTKDYKKNITIAEQIITKYTSDYEEA